MKDSEPLLNEDINPYRSRAPLQTAAPVPRPYRAPWRPGRGSWAIVAHVLAVVGLIVERAGGMCHDFFRGQFDPMGNAPNSTFFVLATILLLSNERVLRSETWRGLGYTVSLIATGAGFAASATMAVFFLPLLVFSPYLIFAGGLAFLIWLPYLACIVLALQAAQLYDRLDSANRLSAQWIALCSLLTAAATGFWFLLEYTRAQCGGG